DPHSAKFAALSFIAVPPPEPRLLKKHDVITVIIRQESQITSDGKSDLKKDSNLDVHADNLVKLALKNMEIQGGAQGSAPPAVKFGLSRDSKNEAQMDRNDSFTTRMSAEVVDVKPNGTVVVQAKTIVRHDEELQELTLTGICRGTDVTPDNSIYS